MLDVRPLVCRRCGHWLRDHGKRVGFRRIANACPRGTGFFESELSYDKRANDVVSPRAKEKGIGQALAEARARNKAMRESGRPETAVASPEDAGSRSDRGPEESETGG